jgi:hypothetical protein
MPAGEFAMRLCARDRSFGKYWGDPNTRSPGGPEWCPQGARDAEAACSFGLELAAGR